METMSVMNIMEKMKGLIKFFYNNQRSLENEQDSLKNEVLTGNLKHDTQKFKIIFERSSDIVFRDFQVGRQTGTLIFLDGLVNTELIDSDVLKPLLNYGNDQIIPPGPQLIKQLFLEKVITASNVSEGQTVQNVIDQVLSGDTVVLIDGLQQALFISLQQWDKRSVEESSTEPVVRGPRKDLQKTYEPIPF